MRDKLLVSADANCSPLGWPGVKGHTVNYIFEDMIPDMRAAGIDDATIKLLLRRQPGRLPVPSRLTPDSHHNLPVPPDMARAQKDQERDETMKA